MPVFTDTYNTESLKAIANAISSDFPADAGGATPTSQISTVNELQEDISELTAQVCFQNSVIRSLSERLRKIEDSLPLIGL